MHAKRRRRLLKRVKGFKWGRKSKLTLAQVAETKSGVQAYKGRKEKKRDMRALWQIRINSAVRPAGFSYSRFIDALKKAHIELDRKVLSTLAAEHPEIFAKIVAAVKK